MIIIQLLLVLTGPVVGSFRHRGKGSAPDVWGGQPPSDQKLIREGRVGPMGKSVTGSGGAAPRVAGGLAPMHRKLLEDSDALAAQIASLTEKVED